MCRSINCQWNECQQEHNEQLRIANVVKLFTVEDVIDELKENETLDDAISYFDMKKPFTKEEKEVMDLLIKAHDKFVKIEQTHPSDINEWVDGIHRCQSILQGRVVRRDYPDDFHSC